MTTDYKTTFVSRSRIYYIGLDQNNKVDKLKLPTTRTCYYDCMTKSTIAEYFSYV